MEMGILNHLSVSQNCIKSTNKIPEYATNYKKEYLFIRGINEEFKYLINNLDDLNNGLFESHRADRINCLMKRFLKAQERGKLKNVSELKINEDEVENIIEIKENFRCYKIKYDYFEDDDYDPYPGFENIYYIFELFFSKLKIKYEDESDSDSDTEDVEIILDDSDSDSDSVLME